MTSSSYREISPSPALAPYIECFWTGEVLTDHSVRVLPDGCADILFVSLRRELIDVRVVGVMTRAQAVRLTSGTLLLGVRFHPGMAVAWLGPDLQSLNNKSLPLSAVLGRNASDLAQCFSRHECLQDKVAAIEERLTFLPSINDVQKAIGKLVGHNGQLLMEEFAAAAGLGPRQLRRTCLKQSGLSPKHLARILRFRNAISRLRSGEKHMAGLALSCGYYDQAHMIREFRELAGVSPGLYLGQHRE